MEDIQQPHPDTGGDLPDDQLALVLAAASRAMTACYRQGLSALGLSYPQYVVMLVLWEHGHASMKYLGQTLELDSGTLSPLLKRLEVRGLVTRRRDPHDERLVLVAPTDAGRALEEQAREVAGGVERAAAMSGDEVTALCARLDRLTTQVRGPGRSGTPRH
ncbi:MarR family winged helix-turn-helix transcriptional regulator [Actinomycetospora endophytica]|uniref:MarR family winged helix-turn-helix transcriptional regulator n=1 Tax=Actinomycetospora endophytica TaxID=2291215 RepID=UPI0027E330C3|nr:MarR family transcriptional regulator [Actinomycetospora endophytica]